MGYEGVSNLLPKVSDQHLRHDMSLHMDGYRHFSTLAKEKLTDAHITPNPKDTANIHEEIKSSTDLV